MNPALLNFVSKRKKSMPKVCALWSALKKSQYLGTVFHYSPAIVVDEFSIWFRPHPRAAGRMSAATATATARATATAMGSTATATSATISCPLHRT
jgi:hypothetical protein